MNEPQPQTSEKEIAHLYGGPMDGDTVEVNWGCQAHIDLKTNSAYTYCPHATKRLGKTTFISACIAHDALAD